MKKFDVRWATLIVFTLLLSGWWYWYEYRPQEIKEDCSRYTTSVTVAAVGDPNIKGSREAFAQVTRQMLQDCINAGGIKNFQNALNVGQSYDEKN